MRVATVERFADPSRRCEPSLLAGPNDDEVVVWDLIPRANGQIPSLIDVARSLPAWALLPVSAKRRWQFLVACYQMRGLQRRSAFICAPDWIRQVQAREIDEVACFSADGFTLAQLLAEESETTCREQLSNGTQYFGEFAFELLAVVPYAYWLHQQGRLKFTISSPDTRCLYYFSPHHIERATERRYVPITEYPIGERGCTRFDRYGFPALLDTTRWSPPPYGAQYADDRFRWPKPLVVVCNKASDERYLRRGFAVNYLDVDLLLDVVGRLTTKYTVVYNRPRASDIVGDDSDVREMGDFEAVKQAFPDVITIQELHARHPDLTFNELQLRLFASCSRFVSVLGGASYLASYFGGTNVIYAQQGWEIDCGAYEGWFDQFSGARIIAARTRAELLRAVQHELLTGDDDE